MRARPLLAVGLVQLLGAVVLGAALLAGSIGRNRVLAGGQALLTVTGVPSGVPVLLYEIEPARYDWSEKGEVLGRGEVTDVALEPGNYLVRARKGERSDEAHIVLEPADDARVALELSDRVPEGMVRIPGDLLRFQGRYPVRVRGFFVARKEITNADWKAFVDSDPDRGPLPGWPAGALPAALESHAATGMSLEDAMAYARSRRARLPTEAEWELAAGGPDCLRFPWGDEPDAARVGDCYRPGPHPEVVTKHGLQDTIGRTLEWIGHRRFMTPPSAIDPARPPDSGAARGGSVNNTFDPGRLELYDHRNRGYAVYESGSSKLGIRLARSDWQD